MTPIPQHSNSEPSVFKVPRPLCAAIANHARSLRGILEATLAYLLLDRREGSRVRCRFDAPVALSRSSLRVFQDLCGKNSPSKYPTRPARLRPDYGRSFLVAALLRCVSAVKVRLPVY